MTNAEVKTAIANRCIELLKKGVSREQIAETLDKEGYKSIIGRKIKPNQLKRFTTALGIEPIKLKDGVWFCRMVVNNEVTIKPL